MDGIAFAFILPMGRVRGLIDSGLHYHVIARCNNGLSSLKSEDFSIYISICGLLKENIVLPCSIMN
jgi:hypothetical protein